MKERRYKILFAVLGILMIVGFLSGAFTVQVPTILGKQASVEKKDNSLLSLAKAMFPEADDIWVVHKRESIHFDIGFEERQYRTDYTLRNGDGRQIVFRACRGQEDFKFGDRLLIIPFENPATTYLPECYTKVSKLSE